jgi:hypothetical protein
VPTVGCSVVSGVDLSDFEPMFVEMLLQPLLMDTLIKRHCDEFECSVHARFSLLSTLLIFFAFIVIFALISLLIMSRFNK